MKRTALLILALITAFQSYGQLWKRNRLEVYAGLPLTHYFGDIGGSASASNNMGLGDISINAVRSGISGGVSYRFKERFYVRSSILVGFFGNTDKNSRNAERNYGFSTFGTEIAATAVYFIYPESSNNYFYSVMQLRGGPKMAAKTAFSFYTFLGVGGVFFIAKPRLNLEDADRPGEVNFSKKSSLLIPCGFGMKYQFRPQVTLGIELGARYLFSDYFDGISTIYSKYNDIYYTLGFYVYYKIPYRKLLGRHRWSF